MSMQYVNSSVQLTLEILREIDEQGNMNMKGHTPGIVGKFPLGVYQLAQTPIGNEIGSVRPETSVKWTTSYSSTTETSSLSVYRRARHLLSYFNMVIMLNTLTSTIRLDETSTY